MTSKVISKIERLYRSFMWKGGTHNVKWDKVSKPRSHGSLGIQSIEHENKALLAKWIWRYDHEENAFGNHFFFLKRRQAS